MATPPPRHLRLRWTSRFRCRRPQAPDRRAGGPDAGRRAGRPGQHERTGRRDPELDPVLRLPAGSAACLPGAGHRWRLRPPWSHPHAREPGPSAGRSISPLARLDIVEARPERGTGPRGRPGPRHADRSGPARTGQGGQEVQSPAARGGPPDPDEEDPAADRWSAVSPCSSCWLSSEDGSSIRSTTHRTTSAPCRRTSPPSMPRCPSTTWWWRPTTPTRPASTRRASVLNAAIDWPLALSNLISITPSRREGQTFAGASPRPLRHSGASVPLAPTPPRRQPGEPATGGHADHVRRHRNDPARRHRSRAEPLHLRGLDQRRRRIAAFANPLQGRPWSTRTHHLVPVRHLRSHPMPASTRMRA